MTDQSHYPVVSYSHFKMTEVTVYSMFEVKRRSTPLVLRRDGAEPWRAFSSCDKTKKMIRSTKVMVMWDKPE